ncbi:unnamed protein product, partial [Brugia timori]|uniref:Bestrophin homolog n=1 Tax=Brugia timori TaxID=42155 RepID=A0A0R3Q7L1_9BILA
MISESQEWILHTILHLLFTLCIVYPPVEFQRAGFTIQTLFSGILGVERDDFVGYHLRRSLLTLYFVYLSMVLRETIFTPTPQTVLQFGAYVSIAIAGVAAFIMLYHWWNGFDKHSTVHCLKSYLGSNGSSWRVVAESINAEYRNVLDTLSITLSGIDRVVMTSSWILYITNYTLICAQVSDVSLEAIRADEHPVLLYKVAFMFIHVVSLKAKAISHHTQNGGSAQFINICVSSTTQLILIRAESFRDLRNKLDKPIAVAREVVLKQSLNERFVEAFTQQIALNPKYEYDEPERLEPCLGCSTEMSNIKLWK